MSVALEIEKFSLTNITGSSIDSVVNDFVKQNDKVIDPVGLGLLISDNVAQFNSSDLSKSMKQMSASI